MSSHAPSYGGLEEEVKGWPLFVEVAMTVPNATVTAAAAVGPLGGEGE